MGRVWRVAYGGNAGYELQCRGGILSTQKETFDEQRRLHLTWARFQSPFVSVFTSKEHAYNWARRMRGSLIYEIEMAGLTYVGGEFDHGFTKFREQLPNFRELLIVGSIPGANVVGTIDLHNPPGLLDLDGDYDVCGGRENMDLTDYLCDAHGFLCDDEYEFEYYMHTFNGVRRLCI